MSEIDQAIAHTTHAMGREHPRQINSGGCPYSNHATAVLAEPTQQEQVQAPSAFVALSKFVVVNGTVASVKQAFRERPHLVDDVPGFLRLEVLSPQENESEIWLLTYWTDAESFHVWHKSHMYREAHKGIPKGIKLDPRMTELRFFEHVCS